MTPLHEIAFMDFNQLSAFVERVTNKTHYIANPSEASDIDCDVCAEHIITTVIMPALKGEHERIDSRSRKLTSDYAIAEMLASAARTYWMDHGFIIAQNARVSRAITASIIESERAEAKREMIVLQMQTIGAILEAKKTPSALKQGLQACWDFNESELLLAQMNGDLSFADLAPEVSF